MRKKWCLQGELFGLRKKRGKTGHFSSRALLTRKVLTKNRTTNEVNFQFQCDRGYTKVAPKIENIDIKIDNPYNHTSN